MARPYDQPCPVAASLDVLGSRWTLLVVRELLLGRTRFSEIAAGLPGIAHNLLSDRLKLLERHEIVTRRVLPQRPPRTEYRLTDAGRDLDKVIAALGIWGSEHAFPDVRPVHVSCGTPVVHDIRCPECDTTLGKGDVTVQSMES